MEIHLACIKCKRFVARTNKGVCWQYLAEELAKENSTLKQQRDDLLEALKELHTQEGVTAVGPHNTGSRPDICCVCAAIDKCKA